MTPDLLKALIAACPCAGAHNTAGEIVGYYTPPARLAFAYLDKPRAKSNGGDSYECALIFPTAADIGLLRDGCTIAAQAFFGPKFEATAKSQGFKRPIKEQGPMAEKYQGFEAGGFFINANSQFKPAIVGGDLKPLEASAVYSGCWVRAKVQPAGFDTDGNRGVKFYLQSIQKLGDDDEFKSIDPTGGFAALPAAAMAAGVSQPAAAAGGASSLF